MYLTNLRKFAKQKGYNTDACKFIRISKFDVRRDGDGGFWSHDGVNDGLEQFQDRVNKALTSINKYTEEYSDTDSCCTQYTQYEYMNEKIVTKRSSTKSNSTCLNIDIGRYIF